MKILHITALHLNPTSGVPTVLKELVTWQNMIKGVEARVLSINAEVDKMNSPYFDYLGSEKVRAYLTRYSPDIAIFHSFFYIEYAIVARELKELKIPFVIEPHGSFGKMAMEKSNFKKKIANATIFKYLIKGANAYIFTNKAEKADSIYRTTMEYVIPNGVIITDVRASAQKEPESQNNPIFYYLGRYDIHHKGLDYLFDALDIIDKTQENVTIHFYGTGTEKEIGFVRDRIGRLTHVNAEEKGAIFGEDKKRELETCHILVLTSRYEGSPMTILDALTYGNPCLVTPGTNVAEELSENKIGWRTDLSAADIAKTILEARDEYSSHGPSYYDRCKRYVIENYAWDKLAKQSVAAIKEILGA